MSACATVLLCAVLSGSSSSTGSDIPDLPLNRAEELIGSHGCMSCHAVPDTGGGEAAAAQAWFQPKQAPDLSTVGERLGPNWLRSFLSDPQAAKPWVTMPDLVAKLAPEDREAAVEKLVHYLASLGESRDQRSAFVDHSLLEDGRWLYREVGCVVCHGPAEPDWQLDATLAELWTAEAAGVELFESPDPDEEEDEPYVQPGTLEPWNLPLAPLVEQKYTAPALEEFLLDPLALRPSGHMPDLALDPAEARAIAAYLLRERARPGPEELRVAGLAYALFEPESGIPDFENDEPVLRGSAVGPVLDVRRRDENFGLRFEGTLHVPESGEWTLATNSDDGSMLWINGELVVDNGGDHAPRTIEGQVTLEAGDHELLLTFYERGGGELLEVFWARPGTTDLVEIPETAFSHVGMGFRPLDGDDFQVDRRMSREGQALFLGLGCVACHQVGDPKVDDAPRVGTAAGPGLHELAGLEASGCLAPKPSAAGGARYVFDGTDTQALLAYLETDGVAPQAPTAALRVARQLQRLNCYGCHRRDDLGGVHPSIKDYFQADEEAEVGDEARYPPPLSGVGAKLRRPTLEDVLLRGDRVRDYVAVRMPQYGEEAVGWLAAALESADLRENPARPRGQDLTPERLAQAQHLAGREGLGCIQCHDFGGIASLGIRAVDMARMHERLRPDWFRRLLRDPAEVNMNTRMANLWVDDASPVKDVFDGDPDQQIQLIWDYLSLGEAMPYPDGLVVPDSAYELHPTERAQSVGAFWEDVGPRVVAVGTPQRIHYAFDVGASRLVRLWRGAFFNARGTWHGRAGQLEGPGSEDELSLPPGLVLARLSEPGQPWPSSLGNEVVADAAAASDAEPTPDAELEAQETARVQALGRTIDGPSGLPTFRFSIDGIEVAETIEPRVAIGGAGVMRRLELRAEVDSATAGDTQVWLRVAVGTAIEAQPDGSFAVQGEKPHSVRLELLSGEPSIVQVGDFAELRVPVLFRPEGKTGPFGASFAWEIQW